VTEFQPWPKTPRFFRDIVITEKIDGTNAAVLIHEYPFGFHAEAQPWDGKIVKIVLGPDNPETGLPDHEYTVSAQSRKRLITPTDDNAGFAQWVWDNADHLVATLGIGAHFGEWWGKGIQRQYGKDRRIFSLFNTSRWGDILAFDPDPHGLAVVPVLYEGPMSEDQIFITLDGLKTYGSEASPGYLNPEGIIIFHKAANSVFKVLLENDDLAKSAKEVVEEAIKPSLFRRLFG
jgi:hypothetical protein